MTLTSLIASYEPKVYVACLGCYNEGTYKGKWMDADELEAEWEKENGRRGRCFTSGFYPMTGCKELNHDEWAIHDRENLVPMSENPDIEFTLEIMRCIEEHGDAFRTWFKDDAWNMSHLKGQLAATFLDRYRGEYESPKAFAEEFATEVGWISKDSNNPLFRYVDFDWYWKSDLRHSFTYSNGHVWCCE